MTTTAMSTSTAVSGLHSTGLLGAMLQGQRAEAACRSSSSPSSPASTSASPPSSSAADRDTTRSQRTRDAARERIGDFVMLDSLVAGNRAMARSRNATPSKPRDAEQESIYSTSSYASTRSLLKKTLSGWSQ